MYTIQYDDIPCWYELGWQNQPPALIVRLHKEIIPSTLWPAADSPPILDFQKTYGFKNFEVQLEQGFGFERAFTFVEQDAHWLTLRGDIPTMIAGSTTCSECNGTGTREIFEDTCPRCKGSKKMRVISWHKLNALSASCAVLFGYPLFMFQGKTSAHQPQLLTLECILQSGWHGASMGGHISKALALWCKARGNDVLDEPTLAMRTALRRLQGKLDKYDERETYLRIDQGNIFATCPGNATQIHPASGYIENVQEGFELGCHNLDSAWQQLTFFAGLASLHDLARSEMQKPSA